MKEALLTVLRKESTPTVEFRKTVEQLAYILAAEAACDIPLESQKVKTPFAEYLGKKFAKEVVLVPILRSGVALLHPFLEMFPGARVGFIGSMRDERTAKPHLYYDNFPPFHQNDLILILDPILATGGTAMLALSLLQKWGATPKNIRLYGILCATPGRKAVHAAHPDAKLHFLAEDPDLNSHKYIVPGLGDFGNRFFHGENS